MTWSIMKSKAKFDELSTDFRYRYSLIKLWDEKLPKATVIMLNPSIANELKNDLTVNRCLNFLIDNQYGSLEIVNLFAYIETDSKKLKASQQYIGPENDEYIRKAIKEAATIIVSWGSDNEYKTRKRHVLSLLGEKPLEYFEDFSNRTIPTHISRLRNGFELRDYNPSFK